MCRTLIRKGWRVVGWDPFPPALARAVSAGAVAARDAAELGATTEVVITSVPDAAALEAVVCGERGLLAAGCRVRTLIDTSTIAPQVARDMALMLAEHKVAFLDAPVSGGVTGAETGTLSAMVGADAEAFADALPVLESIAATVTRCGTAGAGQITKACNQLVVMATLEAVAEALVLARSAGIDPAAVREALLGGYARSPILEQQGARMLRGDFAPGGRAVYHLKDIASITRLAAEHELHLPAFRAAAAQVERLVSMGGGDLDHSALITALEPLSAGVARNEGQA
jgi:2-hydroxy-3-oxopropionate reductase